MAKRISDCQCMKKTFTNKCAEGKCPAFEKVAEGKAGGKNYYCNNPKVVS